MQSPFLIDRTLQPTEQLSHILHEPIAFIKTVVFTHVTGFGDGLIPQMVGVFGWLDTVLPFWAILLYLGILVIAAGQSYRREQVLPGFHRLAMLAIATGVILAIDVLLYLYWNPLASTIIAGIQGRYYLPILPLIVYACAGLYSVTFNKLQSHFVIMGGILTVLLATLITLVQRFY